MATVTKKQLKEANLLRKKGRHHLVGIPNKSNNCFVLGWKLDGELTETDYGKIAFYMDNRTNKKPKRK